MLFLERLWTSPSPHLFHTSTLRVEVSHGVPVRVLAATVSRVTYPGLPAVPPRRPRGRPDRSLAHVLNVRHVRYFYFNLSATLVPAPRARGLSVSIRALPRGAFRVWPAPRVVSGSIGTRLHRVK